MDDAQNQHVGGDTGHFVGNGEKAVPCVNFDLIHAGSQPGEVFPLVLGVVVRIALVQERSRHVLAERVVQLADRVVVGPVPQGFQAGIGAPHRQFHDAPKEERAVIQRKERVKHLHHQQADVCLHKLQYNRQDNGQHGEFPMLFQIIGHGLLSSNDVLRAFTEWQLSCAYTRAQAVPL